MLGRWLSLQVNQFNSLHLGFLSPNLKGTGHSFMSACDIGFLSPHALTELATSEEKCGVEAMKKLPWILPVMVALDCRLGGL